MELLPGYEDLTVYYGDLHNHCGIGYGHGSAEEAFTNARIQLDFAAITAHGHWPDMPLSEVRLESTVDYHRSGFERAQEEWERFREVVAAFNQSGHFITFLGFEWHSMQYGDHHVIYNGSRGEILRPDNLQEMRQMLRHLREQGIEGFVIPHHIGYKSGYRGINWSSFDPEFSPVVEIMSMHGASESDEGAYPFLHTMGPCDWCSTFQYGLAQGHRPGVVGSTDHHSAHPGSYGHGRLGVWASSLTRDGIWEAIRSRRTYALTGDRIRLSLTVNGQPMGSTVPNIPHRQIEITVEGGNALDEVVLVYNNAPLQVWNGRPSSRTAQAGSSNRYKLHFEVGWAEKDWDVDWDVALQVLDGDLLAVEPRFRGREVVAPEAGTRENYQFSDLHRTGEAGVWFRTRTWGNPTTTTANTQGVCLELLGTPGTRIQAKVNGQVIGYSLGELIAGARVGYLGGFLTPAFYFHRAVPSQEFLISASLNHRVEKASRDWYYVRVRQKNNQYAWSSPVWIDA